MTEDLTELPAEMFFRLAVERGGLDLDEVIEGLSPEAADALRLIAAGTILPRPIEESTRGTDQSKAIWDLEPTVERGIGPPSGPKVRVRNCSACGHSTRPGDHFCRQCGCRLDESAAAVSVSLADLVTQGRLTTEQARKVERTILDFQSNYPAGTRYSVFGGPQ